MKHISLIALWLFASVLGVSQNLSSTGIDFAPAISADGSLMIVQSNKEGQFGLYQSSKDSLGQWTIPEPITVINDYFKPYCYVNGPSLNADASLLYFSAYSEKGNGDMDLYVSKRKDSSWSNPENLGTSINSAASETFPSISPDGSTLMFSRQEKLKDSISAPQLLISKKDKNDWTKPQALTEVPATYGTFVYDGQHAYLQKSAFSFVRTKSDSLSKNQVSDKESPAFLQQQKATARVAVSPEDYRAFISTGGDIQEVIVPDEWRLHGIHLTGTVKDADNNQGLAARLALVDTLNNDTLQIIQTAENGSFDVQIVPGARWRIVAMKDRYNKRDIVMACTKEEPFRAVQQDILIPARKKKVVFRVSDEDSDKGLNVKIKVTNLETGEVSYVDGNREGVYALTLREGDNYNVEVNSVKGYSFANQKLKVDENTDSLVAQNVGIKVQRLKTGTRMELDDILFSSGSKDLDSSSFEELDLVVDMMKKNPTAKVEISAHTDKTGDERFNVYLSDLRAQEVVKYLGSKGISKSRLISKGYGSSKPLDPDDTEESYALNRRVELKITGIQ
jgi:outer membrane protein OmpA-like peptidoglycan-associated protein